MRMIRALVLATVAVCAIAPLASAEPPDTHEYLPNRPSGFWTSNRPAVGGAYRYRLLLIGVVVAAGMGWFTVRLIKRSSRGPDPRSPGPQAGL